MDDEQPVDPESNEKILSTIASLCSEPDITVTCPVCGVPFVEQPHDLNRLSAHLLDLHQLRILNIQSICYIEVYVCGDMTRNTIKQRWKSRMNAATLR